MHAAGQSSFGGHMQHWAAAAKSSDQAYTPPAWVGAKHTMSAWLQSQKQQQAAGMPPLWLIRCGSRSTLDAAAADRLIRTTVVIHQRRMHSFRTASSAMASANAVFGTLHKIYIDACGRVWIIRCRPVWLSDGLVLEAAAPRSIASTSRTKGLIVSR